MKKPKSKPKTQGYLVLIHFTSYTNVYTVIQTQTTTHNTRQDQLRNNEVD